MSRVRLRKLACVGGEWIIGEDGDDPGWSIGWGSLLAVLVPRVAIQRARTGDILLGIRRAWC